MTTDTDTDTFEPLTPDQAWELLWRPMVFKDGEYDFDVVKTLLHDYGVLLNNNATLFPYLTDNRITDPQHDLEEVIQIADECMAANMDAAIRQVLDLFFERLNELDGETDNIRLFALLDLLNLIYERGLPND